MEKDKEDRKEIREPFRPEDTPRPPQEDPSTDSRRETPIKGKQREPTPDSKADNPGNESKKDDRKAAEPSEKKHLLNDEADIDDETTI